MNKQDKERLNGIIKQCDELIETVSKLKLAEEQPLKTVPYEQLDTVSSKIRGRNIVDLGNISSSLYEVITHAEDIIFREITE